MHRIKKYAVWAHRELEDGVSQKGKENIEERAYLWFIRLIFFHFMEVKGYCERITEIHKMSNFAYMVKKYHVFEKIMPTLSIAKEEFLLFPENLGNVMEQMLMMIPEEHWENVQIIGWLYQSYNSEKKIAVFSDLKKNIKITKEMIPVATQLFTPDWIVRYMVENSLGRLWAEGHKKLKDWDYYIEEAKQEKEVESYLMELKKNYKTLKPQEIKCIDPCCGSGNILAYLFDVLMQIYKECGYSTKDAVTSIIQNNIYGLDIDEHAAQLAYFTIIMKVRQYNGEFIEDKPHIYAIMESNQVLKYDCSCTEWEKVLKMIEIELYNAKEYGSLLTITPQNWSALYKHLEKIKERDIQLLRLIKTAEILSQKYHVVVTNPPYMIASNMNQTLLEFVKKNYPDSKSDLFAVYIEKCNHMLLPYGFNAMITMQSWMFLSSFQKLRTKLQKFDMINMIHLGRGAFKGAEGEVVQTSAFVMRKSHIKNYTGTYCRLTDDKQKEKIFFSGKNRYLVQQHYFSKIPGNPMIYWINQTVFHCFEIGKRVDSFAYPKQGLATGNNKRFVRFWFEVDKSKIGFSMPSREAAFVSRKKWFPYNKGGGYRKWYGNHQYVINWEKDGFEIKNFKGSAIRNTQFYFKKGISWCKVTGNHFSMRFIPQGFLFDVAGCTLFVKEQDIFYVLGYMNSCVNTFILSFVSPTLNCEVGHIASLPILFDEAKRKEIETLVCENIVLCKKDWDSFELSYDFQCHPLIRRTDKIEQAFLKWQTECNTHFYQLKDNEERLNSIFIEIYNLQKELSPFVKEKEVSIHKAELQRDIKSLISYVVGCLFGRYKIKGIDLEMGRSKAIPVCDYFSENIVNQFIAFIKRVYGTKTLEQNLKFIAEALGGKGQPKEAIKNYFFHHFYADHVKYYQKCPIYWLLDSGEKKVFQCFINIHHYQKDTLEQICTEYISPLKKYYHVLLEQKDTVMTKSEYQKYQEQARELWIYEEKIQNIVKQGIEIDLDNGIQYNYKIFQSILAKKE